ncbi:MAG: Flp pilus assembly protein CpaB [Geminicoccaceae bacterium]|nr:Flp pilus assembly protein CpaB [Geminicoccaceae bacterium]
MFRRFLVPVVALMLAGAAAYGARSWLERQRPQPAPAAAAVPEVRSFKEILVAASPLHVGTFSRSDSLRWQEWPDIDVPPTYFVRGEDDPEELEGAVVRRDLIEGDPITEGSLIRPGERGFLAAVLEPDMRAITVPVDEASSNAGLIFPGDLVDLILTQTLAATGGAEKDVPRRVSETVLERVRVLAMGRRMEGVLAGDLEANGKGGSVQVRTATLEVTPRGAEVVALVNELGKLSLSLRGLAQDGDAATTASVPTWDSDVSKVLGASPTSAGAVIVLRGSKREDVVLGEEAAR